MYMAKARQEFGAQSDKRKELLHRRATVMLAKQTNRGTPSSCKNLFFSYRSVRPNFFCQISYFANRKAFPPRKPLFLL